MILSAGLLAFGPLFSISLYMSLNMIKLVVGVQDLYEFAVIQKRDVIRFQGQIVNPVRTRFKPRRAEEILKGGSLYRVIKNRIQCRQRIVGFEELADTPKGRMTLIMVEADIIRTQAMPKKPFQGWRYLRAGDAPPDIGKLGEIEASPPADMADDLARAGLL